MISQSSMFRKQAVLVWNSTARNVPLLNLNADPFLRINESVKLLKITSDVFSNAERKEINSCREPGFEWVTSK